MINSIDRCKDELLKVQNRIDSKHNKEMLPFRINMSLRVKIIWEIIQSNFHPDSIPLTYSSLLNYKNL